MSINQTVHIIIKKVFYKAQRLKKTQEVVVGKSHNITLRELGMSTKEESCDKLELMGL